MAVTVLVTLNTGVVATYWVLMHARIDLRAGVIDAIVHGWLNQEAADAGLAPVDSRSIRLRSADLEAQGITLDITGMLEPIISVILAG